MFRIDVKCFTLPSLSFASPINAIISLGRPTFSAAFKAISSIGNCVKRALAPLSFS
jgi:hypothetical protein